MHSVKHLSLKQKRAQLIKRIQQKREELVKEERNFLRIERKRQAAEEIHLYDAEDMIEDQQNLLQQIQKAAYEGEKVFMEILSDLKMSTQTIDISQENLNTENQQLKRSGPVSDDENNSEVQGSQHPTKKRKDSKSFGNFKQDQKVDVQQIDNQKKENQEAIPHDFSFSNIRKIHQDQLKNKSIVSERVENESDSDSSYDRQKFNEFLFREMDYEVRSENNVQQLLNGNKQNDSSDHCLNNDQKKNQRQIIENKQEQLKQFVGNNDDIQDLKSENQNKSYSKQMNYSQLSQIKQAKNKQQLRKQYEDSTRRKYELIKNNRQKMREYQNPQKIFEQDSDSDLLFYRVVKKIERKYPFESNYQNDQSDYHVDDYELKDQNQNNRKDIPQNIINIQDQVIEQNDQDKESTDSIFNKNYLNPQNYADNNFAFGQQWRYSKLSLQDFDKMRGKQCKLTLQGYKLSKIFSNNKVHKNIKLNMQEFVKYDWRNVEAMDLGDCKLTSNEWKLFCQNSECFQNLRILNLESNFIGYVTKQQLRKFPKIRSLNFGYKGIFFSLKTEQSQNPLQGCSFKQIEQHANQNRRNLKILCYQISRK